MMLDGKRGIARRYAIRHLTSLKKTGRDPGEVFGSLNNVNRSGS